MKSRLLCFLSILVIALVIVSSGRASPTPAPILASAPPLRLGESTDSIMTDLDEFIPKYLQEHDIPGVSITLIRDHHAVWSAGYGVTNSITRKPVTPDNVFAFASNSKVLTTYIALRLVDQGRLSLDQPLKSYLPEPWLPDSPYQDQITLRHVASHTSGLTQIGKQSVFPPGSAYYYSGMGISYLQTVIEQVTNQSLESLAGELVFEPLDMPSASFINRPDTIPLNANGHVHAIAPILLSFIMYLLSLLVITLFGLLINRLRNGIWRPARQTIVWWGIIAFLLSLLLVVLIFNLIGFLEFTWLIVSIEVAIFLILTGMVLLGLRLTSRLFPNRLWQRAAFTTVLVVTALAGIILLAINANNLPVPGWLPTKADGAGSLRAKPADMAKFMIELSNPRYLSPGLAEELRSPQISLANDLSWGLGTGIQHSQNGDALWQWGQHIHSQSIVIIYPDYGFGVIVSTNNDLLKPDVALEIAQRALGGPIESVRRAVHLDFNYQK
jgi:CubicO group peptidase (beta-lactamase class C family)